MPMPLKKADILKKRAGITLDHSPAYTNKQSGRIQLILNRAAQITPLKVNSFSAIPQLCGKYMLLADMTAMVMAFLVGGMLAWGIDNFLLAGGFQPMWSADTLKEAIIYFGLGAVSLLWLDSCSHYRQRLPYWESVGNILAVACMGFLMCGFIEYASQSALSRLWLGLTWVFFALFLFTGRSLVRRTLQKKGLWDIPALLIGTGRSAEAAIHALSRERQMGFTIVEQVAPETLKDLSYPHAWNRLLRACDARHILLALEGPELEENSPLLKSLVREQLPCSIVPPWLGLPVGTLSPHNFLMHDVMLLHFTNRLTLPLPRLLKRSFDILVSGAALLALSPLFLVVAYKVRRDGGKAFFSQARVGKHGKLFPCYKFRSMRMDAEAYLENYLAENPEAAEEWEKFQKLKNDIRITRFGHFIRRTSIDELPQLFNVFRGDMSIVGPRPIMAEQKEYYSDDLVYYESVRPGITGPWQVSGRSKLTFSERVMLESSYARNWSLWMDIVIMLKTFPVVLKNNGQAF